MRPGEVDEYSLGVNEGAGPLHASSGRRRAPPDRVFKLIALVAAACLVGFIIFVVARGPSHSRALPGTAALEVPPPAVLKAGATAPSFSLPSLNGGAPVSLAGFRGTPVILTFFASWCPHCRAELGAIATIARRAGGRVAVVGVDSNDTSTAAASSLLTSAHATYPVGVDAHATVATEYFLSALPATYFVDANGKVVGVSLGTQTVSSLDRWLRRLQATEK